MIPVLRAEEDLRAVTATALGTGSLGKDGGRQALRELRQQATPPGRRRAERPESRGEHERALAGMGIAVRRSKPRPERREGQGTGPPRETPENGSEGP